MSVISKLEWPHWTPNEPVCWHHKKWRQAIEVSFKKVNWSFRYHKTTFSAAPEFGYILWQHLQCSSVFLTICYLNKSRDCADASHVRTVWPGLHTGSSTVSTISTYRTEVCKTRRRVFRVFTWCWGRGERVFAAERVSGGLFILKRVDGLTAKWLKRVAWFGGVSWARHVHWCALTWRHTKDRR